MILLFSEHQKNDTLPAKESIIFNTGHHVKSYLMYIKSFLKYMYINKHYDTTKYLKVHNMCIGRIYLLW